MVNVVGNALPEDELALLEDELLDDELLLEDALLEATLLPDDVFPDELLELAPELPPHAATSNKSIESRTVLMSYLFY